MLHIILLESALELVPPELTAMKSIQKHAGKRGKKPSELLLDQSVHGRAMTKLEDGDRRGRPDIVHFCLQSILETPLCKSGLITIHIELADGRIIEVDSDVRLPRNYDRFVGLMEQLLLKGQVPPTGKALIKFIKCNITELVNSLKKEYPEAVSILAVEGGKKTSMNSVAEMLPADQEIPVLLGVGAFPHGDFQGDVRNIFDLHLEFDKDVMMAWHVCSEILWIYSQKHEIIAQRYSNP